MRTLIIVIALFLGVFVIIYNFSEVSAILDTLRRGEFLFIFLALVVECLWLLNVATSFQAVYRIIGVEEDLKALIMIAAAANFANIVAPSVGMSGMAVFVSQARKREYSTAHAAIAGALYILLDYTGFLCVLALGLILLMRINHLDWAELTASVILVLFAIGLASLLYLGLKSSEALGQTLAWMANRVNRILRLFIHRNYFSEERAFSFAQEAADGLREIRKAPENLLTPVFLAINNKVLLIAVLLLVMLAFKVSITPTMLIGSFCIGYLFFIVSPTPSGVGIVEGVLTVTLHSMGLRLEEAAVVTLAYRGVTFWAPFLFGFLAFRLIGNNYHSPKKPKTL